MNGFEKQQELGVMPSDQDNASEKKGVKKVVFSQLSQGANEVLIEHEGAIYHLKLTRNGKLLLNK